MPGAAALVQILNLGRLQAFDGEGDTVKKMPGLEKLFKERYFEREIIVLCVFWYLRFKLSFRDLVEMMAEGGLAVAHTAILRWAECFVPEFERRWNRWTGLGVR